MKSVFVLTFIAIFSAAQSQAATCYFIDGRLAASVQYGTRGINLHSPFGRVPVGFYPAGPNMSATVADVRAFYDSAELEQASLHLDIGAPGSLYIVTRNDSSPSFISSSAVVNCTN